MWLFLKVKWHLKGEIDDQNGIRPCDQFDKSKKFKKFKFNLIWITCKTKV